jgi:hypothetical protein
VVWVRVPYLQACIRVSLHAQELVSSELTEVYGKVAMSVEVSALAASMNLAVVLRLRDGIVVGQKTVRAYIVVALSVAAVVAAVSAADSKLE